MKTIIQAMLEEIYTKAIEISHAKKQVETFPDNGEDNGKGNYYITLEQLEAILKEFEG